MRTGPVQGAMSQAIKPLCETKPLAAAERPTEVEARRALGSLSKKLLKAPGQINSKFESSSRTCLPKTFGSCELFQGSPSNLMPLGIAKGFSNAYSCNETLGSYTTTRVASALQWTELCDMLPHSNQKGQALNNLNLITTPIETELEHTLNHSDVTCILSGVGWPRW